MSVEMQGVVERLSDERLAVELLFARGLRGERELPEERAWRELLEAELVARRAGSLS